MPKFDFFITKRVKKRRLYDFHELIPAIEFFIEYLQNKK